MQYAKQKHMEKLSCWYTFDALEIEAVE